MSQLLPVAPLIAVASTALLVLLLDLLRKPSQEGGGHLAWISTLGLVTAALLCVKAWPGKGEVSLPFMENLLVVGPFTLFVWLVIIGATALAMLTSPGYDEVHKIDHGEYYAFFSFATAGMMVMTGTDNLLVLFLGMELTALSVYMLVAVRRHLGRSAEGGIKYFFNGCLASAFFIFGLAFVWGQTGEFSMSKLAYVLSQHRMDLLLYIGVAMILVAFYFKIAAVPFHFWTPDAYQAAPSPVSGFMASTVKIAGFSALARFVYAGSVPDLFAALPFDYLSVTAVLAVITMTIGNLLALHQDDPKRMLAYSSVAHAGYLLMGFVLIPQLMKNQPALLALNGSVLFYFVAYAAASIAAFGALTVLGGREGDMSYDDLSGLAKSHPVASVVLTISVLSLAGFPPFAGFFAKFYLFTQVLELSATGLNWLVIIALLNSLVSVAYYLKPVLHIYMKKPEIAHRFRLSPSASFALVAAAITVVVMGVLPSKLLTVSRKAATSVTYTTVATSSDFKTLSHIAGEIYAHPPGLKKQGEAK